jgi:ABC-type glutathione transport system ATPase component
LVNKEARFHAVFALFSLEKGTKDRRLKSFQTASFHPGCARLGFVGACLVNGPNIYNRSVQQEASSQIILAENLVKVYEAGKLWVTAVRDVSLSVQKGEFVAIVGPSGSGKSTLFYLLGGLTRATKGRVVIDGVDFATLDDSERTRLRKRRIGFVFQKFNLLPTLSAMGNIEIAYTISGRKEPTCFRSRGG